MNKVDTIFSVRLDENKNNLEKASVKKVELVADRSAEVRAMVADLVRAKTAWLTEARR